MDMDLIITCLYKYLMAHNNAVAHKDYTISAISAKKTKPARVEKF